MGGNVRCLPMDINRKQYAVVTLLGSLAALLVACGGSSSPADSPGTTARSYTVRGEVRALPKADDPTSSFQLRHETIPDFVDFRGDTMSMDSMTMPFPVTEDQLPAGLAVGDPVAMTFRVDWNGTPAIEVLEVVPLPPGTELEF